jgi:hypothetical protein
MAGWLPRRHRARPRSVHNTGTEGALPLERVRKQVGQIARGSVARRAMENRYGRMCCVRGGGLALERSGYASLGRRSGKEAAFCEKKRSSGLCGGTRNCLCVEHQCGTYIRDG